MTTTKKFRPTAIASYWGEGHTQTPIVRIFGGAGKRGVAVGYNELDVLIKRLEELRDEHRIDTLVDRLVTE